jgi:hypothetical protein
MNGMMINKLAGVSYMPLTHYVYSILIRPAEQQHQLKNHVLLSNKLKNDFKRFKICI